MPRLRREGECDFALAEDRLLMDGAMGSHLLAAGLDCAERACLSAADLVRGLHEGYRRAGARVLLTNTFQLNPTALARHGLEPHLEAIGRRAIHLARVDSAVTVLGDVGPIYTPGSNEEFADREALRLVLEALADANGILFETCSSPAALAAVEYASHRVAAVDGLPLLLSLTYHRNARGELVTFSGHRPETYARHAAQHGVAALGVNCGKDVDMADVEEILKRYRQSTDLPLFARPNAGTPDAGGTYPRSPEQMAAGVAGLIAAGARMIGGCCGTTAAHIAAFAAALAEEDSTSRKDAKTQRKFV